MHSRFKTPRPLHVAILALGMVACSTDPAVGFTLVSTLPASTQGLQLADGAVASAAMDGQICLLDVSEGAVIGDADLGDGRDRLLDAAGDRVLARGDGLFILPRSLAEAPAAVDMVTPTDARLWQDGVVGLYERDGLCGVSWSEAADELWLIPESDCSEQTAMTVDRATGVAWVADGQRITRIARSGAYASWRSTADLLEFDPSTGFALAGQRGENGVAALDADGEIIWSRPTAGELVDLAPAGASGTVAIMSGDAWGGTLEIAMGGNGMPVAEFELPETAEISISDDGSTMAVAKDDQVLFYRVDADEGVLETADTHNADPSYEVVAVAGASAATAGAILGTAVLAASLVD